MVLEGFLQVFRGIFNTARGWFLSSNRSTEFVIRGKRGTVEGFRSICVGNYDISPRGLPFQDHCLNDFYSS